MSAHAVHDYRLPCYRPRTRAPFVILSWDRHTNPVARREQSLLAEIERDALNHSVPLSAALQKCIALGGQARNAELRDWASQELHGYRNDNEVPQYRIIHAPLLIDAVTIAGSIRGQQISATDLPDVAHDVISEEVKLAISVGDLQGLLRNAERSGERTVKLGPSGAADLIKIWNYEIGDTGQTIMRLYWDVNSARISGVLDQIRTTLVRLVSEMRATMSDDALTPTQEQAAQAVSVVLHGGKRNQVTVTTAQADSSATANIKPPDELKESGWTKTQTIWTVIGVIVAFAALYIAYLTWRG